MRVVDVFSGYIASSKWMRLQNSSKRIYMSGFKMLDPFIDREIDSIRRWEILEFLEGYEDRKGNGRAALNVLNNLFLYAMDRNLAKENPCYSVDFLAPTKPIERWSEKDVDMFLTTAPKHLKSAFLLALYTGQRKSDLVRMRWEDYDGKFIKVRQKKTGKELSIPVHPKLRADLEARRNVPQTKGRNLPFIILNSHGDPWTFEGFRKAMTSHASRIGLEGKTVHGIRKTTASILAESGCTPSQIMAITGHGSMKEVQRYTLEADQKRLAKEAVKAWEENHG